MSIHTFGTDIIPETILTKHLPNITRMSITEMYLPLLILRVRKVAVLAVRIVILLLDLHNVINSLVFNTNRGRRCVDYNWMQGGEEKRLLIESMKKLSAHVSNNPKRQKDIFDSLSPADLRKIVDNLHDENENLRKVSALLLCELTFANQEIKRKTAEMLQVLPVTGRICLSGFPKDIQNLPSLIKNCLQLLKGTIQPNEDQKLCWVINLERKNLQIEFINYKKYSSLTFVDPDKNIFGFTLAKQTTSISQVNRTYVSPSERFKPNQTLPIRRSVEMGVKHGEFQRTINMKRDSIERANAERERREQLLMQSARGIRPRQPQIQYQTKLPQTDRYDRSATKTQRQTDRKLHTESQDEGKKSYRLNLTPVSGRRVPFDGNQTDRSRH